METIFPLLPKLKEDSAVNPSKVSSWTTEIGDFLNQLIKSLAVPDDTPELSSIDSIPDVWARPLLFEMALFDNQSGREQQFSNSLYKRVLGEWRCLLAMIALNQVKNLNLRAEQVVLHGEATSSIERILYKLTPGKDGLISQDTDWKTLYIIFYQDVPIALTSPATLVASAADYVSEFDGNLSTPWSTDGRYLADPIPYLTDENLVDLYGWLENLGKSLRQHVRTQEDNREYLMVLKRLEEYGEAIKAKLGHGINGETNVESGILGLNRGIFRFLDTIIPAKAGTSQESSVKLLPSYGRKPDKDILIISPQALQSMAERWNIPKTQLNVWAGITANDVTEKLLSENKGKLGNISLANTEYRRPEDFFTDKLTFVEPADVLPGALKIRGEETIASDINANCRLLIPLKAEVLEYLDAEEIVECIWLDRQGDSIYVHFTFPVSGVGGQQKYEFIKQYKDEDIIYVIKTMPDIEIWPDFKREDWHRYYFYYGNAESQNNAKDPGKDFLYAVPWIYGQENGKDVPEKGLANQYTACIPAFPEALQCYVNCSVQGSSRSKVEEGGLILLKQPKTIDINALASWDISVDFGTSSTMVYYKDRTKDPEKLSFTPHLYQVTNSGSLRNNLYSNFMPEKTMNPDGSFLTIYHILNTSLQKTDYRTLQDGHIFPLEMEDPKIAYFVTNEETIDANLKWQGDAQGTDSTRRKVKSYLEQICLQSVAEAAGRGGC